jgi:O6-methylguanine-DNA--protein-cysteine methyltransferase
MWFDEFTTPVGKLTAAVDDSSLRHVLFQSNRHPPPPMQEWVRDEVATQEAREQLLEYFAGDRKSFTLQINPVDTPNSPASLADHRRHAQWVPPTAGILSHHIAVLSRDCR